MKRRKNNWLNIIFYNPKVISVLGLAVIILLSFPLTENISKRNRIEDEVTQLKNEIETLESQNKNLDNLIGYLESDEFVEEQARLNLGLKKPGEKIVVIKDEGRVAGASDKKEEDRENSLSDKKSNPKKWWNYFFK